ncbi:hypothetical protein POM88_008940 [Heracleum sosnowskyi]|uniref:Vicilin n=1 Tax=Heracleum sosnowskyi TaxID=360622 RepID=A0AAD8N7R7_9APIA|nr:hypothetical protein POM88_008940 [Heracleum sosnowskyi]
MGVGSLTSFTAIAFDTRDANCKLNTQSPEERYRACLQHCEQHRPQCGQQCIEKYRKEQQKDDNPYAFKEQHFTTIESQHGRLRFLQKFLDCIKVAGRGRVIFLHPDGRESINLQQGDIYRFYAGTTAYLINPDKREKLEIASLIQPVSAPGEFKEFFGSGGENPKSFLTTFSAELLEAAFKASL